jgi:serine/threonine-protein kinase HipA
MVKHRLAKVYLWGELIGVLADNDNGICAFEYTPSWIAKGIEISPIHLPLNKRIYAFPSLSVNTYKGLPAVFTDTLPDDFGNAVINAWLAREGRDVESFSPIERLLYTGKRGMGALEYMPALANRCC